MFATPVFITPGRLELPFSSSSFIIIIIIIIIVIIIITI